MYFNENGAYCSGHVASVVDRYTCFSQCNFVYMDGIQCTSYHRELLFLPLDVDSINENDSVANPDPTPRITSVHKSRFAEVVLVGCWMEAVYYCLLLRKR